MDNIGAIIAQELIEKQFNRKHIDTKIREEIAASEDMQAKIAKGITLVQEFLAGTYYQSKMDRLQQIQGMDIPELVLDILVGTAYVQRPELFTSVTAQMASRLKFDDKTAAITTVAELMAVLCNVDAFDIFKEDKQASLMVESTMGLSQELTRFIEQSSYLPPMVCKPLELTHNFSSGYLTHNDSLILGSGNHHDGDICLDAINIMNSVALKLDLDFICNVEENPTFDLDTQDKIEQWGRFKEESYGMYSMLQRQGNRFYLTHKVDKRGRLYSCGYHVSTMGTAFKKACIELANEEIITGVP